MASGKQEKFADFLRCASVLEKRTYSLYMNLADRVDHPLIKSLLLHIAYDSQKHSAIVNGISDTISKQARPPKDCKKKLAGVLGTIEQLIRETTRDDKASNGNVPMLIEKLTALESMMGEEYYILVQLKTLQYMTKEIREIYNVDIEDLKDILETIIEDEENHEEILSKIKKILSDETREVYEKAPSARYGNPDAWIRHIPPGIT